jgi:uncharacterized protein
LDSPLESSISQLAALQDLDRQRREQSELAQTLQAEIGDLEGQLQRQREETRALQAERDAAEAKRQELENQLEAEEVKMKDRRMRLNRVRNEKELQALRREIEVGKEANQLLEDELLRIMEALEELTAKSVEAAGKLAELEASAGPTITERRARVEQIEADVASQRERRDQMAQGLDINLRRKYEQIFERRGGTAVVEVRNGTCQGCHMNLPPQFFNELQRSREVRLCPNCHRILFWRPERLEPADTPR